MTKRRIGHNDGKRIPVALCGQPTKDGGKCRRPRGLTLSKAGPSEWRLIRHAACRLHGKHGRLP